MKATMTRIAVAACGMLATCPLTGVLLLVYGLTVRAADTVTLCESGATVKPLPYSAEELLSQAGRYTYRGSSLDQIRFPLGGVGSGCISLNGRGALVDWSIFGNPNIGWRPELSFLGLWMKAENEEAVFRVLEGEKPPPYGWGGESQGNGPLAMVGMPHMRTAVFEGRFPFAKVTLSDPGVPLEVTLEGWSPFIPGNDRESSLPVACLNITLKNVSGKAVKGTLGYNLKNLAAEGNDAGTRTELLRRDGYDLLLMRREDSAKEGSLAVATPHRITTWQRRWAPSGMGPNGGIQTFAETFCISGRYDRVMSDVSGPETWDGGMGSIGMEIDLKPGASTRIPMVLSWHFPERKDVPGVRNYYSTQWPDAAAVADYLMANRERLERETRLFQATFFASTLPGVILESVSSQLSILRSPTVFREANGTLHGWEGCLPTAGSCAGTVTHVYHYVQSIAYLFPALERGMREFDFSRRMDPQTGGLRQRVWPTGRDTEALVPVDGHFGTILRVCREWQVCGDTEWLRRQWPGVKKAIGYPWTSWDKDRDGRLDPNTGWHCTLDQSLYGDETYGNGMYMAGMLAGEKMARAMGDVELAGECRRVFEIGRKKTDELCWNGEYYRQIFDGTDTRSTWLNGVISEQLIGQWWSDMLGLGEIYPRERMRSAIAAVFKYNFVPDCRKLLNTGYTLAVNDDAGLVICSWPKGGRPAQALYYADTIEVGYEDQVAANLIYHGYVLEGLAVMKAIRDRYDGRKRDPYNQLECGGYYARSMANYSLLLALSGCRMDASAGRLEFAPKVTPENFTCFFAAGEGWGSFSQRREGAVFTASLDVMWGQLRLRTLSLPLPNGAVKVSLAGRPVDCTATRDGEQVVVALANETVVSSGQTMTVVVRPTE